MRLQSESHSARPTNPLEWAERYRRIEGRPFSLDRFPALREIYLDTHPHIVVIKPAQRGISEWAINLTMFALDRGAELWTSGTDSKNGLNIGYFFPTAEALSDFSKERMTGLAGESDDLQRMFGEGEFDAVKFKQVGNSYLYLRGAKAGAGLLSFSADMIVLDEFDQIVRENPNAPSLAQKRMNASVVAREVDISTPTIPGIGIHAMYLQSDQRVYRTVCPGCQNGQTFDFFRDVRVGGADWGSWQFWAESRLNAAPIELVCPECGYSLSDDERCGPGYWESQQPEVERVRGYQVPWWPFSFLRLSRLVQAAVRTEPSAVTEFFRSDLGLPYAPAGARVTEDMMSRLSADLPNGRLPDVGPGGWSRTTMGVDIGARLHYRISSTLNGRRYVRAMSYVDNWENLDQLMTEYRVRMCVVDAMPELKGAQAFAARWQGRVLRSFYPASQTAELAAVQEDKSKVNVNRTMAMDSVYARIAGGQEVWPDQFCKNTEIVRHMTAPNRVKIEKTDGSGDVAVSWVHTAPDHWFHASVYDMIAETVLPKAAIGGMVGVGIARGWI